MSADHWAASPNPPGVLVGGFSVGNTGVELRFPARPEFLGMIRLASMEFAARMGFEPDVTADFTMAVNEACTAAVVAESRQVLVSLKAADSCLEGQIIHVPGRGSRDWKNGSEALYSALVLYSLADVVQTDTREGPVVTRISKGRTRVAIG
jgi:hypothetical protein